MNDIPANAEILPEHQEYGRLRYQITRPGDKRWAVAIYASDDELGWTAILHMQDTGPPAGNSYEFATDHHKDTAEEALAEVPFLFQLADFNDRENDTDNGRGV